MDAGQVLAFRNKIINRKIKIILLSGIILSCLSGLIPNEAMVTHPSWNNDGRDCTKNACQIAASGWPIPFIWDQTWLSPTNSADWLGVLIEDDHLSFLAFIKNIGFWGLVSLTGLYVKNLTLKR